MSLISIDNPALAVIATAIVFFSPACPEIPFPVLASIGELFTPDHAKASAGCALPAATS